MAIENINPLSNSVIGPADSFSFDIDNTYTSLVVKIGAAGGDEYAYDYALGGAQTGYTVTITNLGSQDRITVKRDSGWDKEPVAVTVVENETGSIVTTQFQLYLTSTKLYPEGMQPYSDAYEGTLIVTEEDVQVRGDVGWIDYNGTDFDLVDLGNGKVRINANETLKQGGAGGPTPGPSLAGIGKWTVVNVAGGGTPAAGEIIINSSDNTAVTSILMSTTTEDGQNYDEWFQRFTNLTEGLTLTVYDAETGTKWFSSAVSSMSLGTANYRNFTLNHADKTNSGAHTWAVNDEVFIEVLPAYPDTSALTEPSTYGLGRMIANTATTEQNPNTGFFQFNNANPQLATKIWLYRYCAHGADLSDLLLNGDGSEWTFHAKDILNGMVQGRISGAILKENGVYDWYECDWTPVAGSTSIVNNEKYGLDIVKDGSDVVVNGFVDMDDVDVSINEGTRTLTLTGTFSFYSHGKLFTVTDPSTTWSDSYSPFFFQFDNTGTLFASSSMTPATVKTNCLVGYLWWHQVNNETCGGFYNLMKHHTVPPDVWFHELFNRGLEYNYGANPNTVATVADGDGSADTHCQLGIYSGHFLLGGTKHEMTSRTPATAVPKAKRLGSDSGGFYEQLDTGTTGLVATTGSGRAGYNLANSLTECADDSYVWAHMIARTGDNYDEAKDIIWIGLGNYTTKPLAEQAVVGEVSTIMKFPQNTQGGMQAAMCPIASVLIHTKSTYTNNFKSRRVSLSNGDAWVAWWDQRFHPKLYSGLGPAPGGPVGTVVGINPPAEVAGVPGASNDQDEGYTPGSLWINTSLNDVYICCDASSGAAVWKIIAT
jgi:hypothetical protein